MARDTFGSIMRPWNLKLCNQKKSDQQHNSDRVRDWPCLGTPHCMAVCCDAIKLKGEISWSYPRSFPNFRLMLLWSSAFCFLLLVWQAGIAECAIFFIRFHHSHHIWWCILWCMTMHPTVWWHKKIVSWCVQWLMCPVLLLLGNILPNTVLWCKVLIFSAEWVSWNGIQPYYCNI